MKKKDWWTWSKVYRAQARSLECDNTSDSPARLEVPEVAAGFDSSWIDPRAVSLFGGHGVDVAHHHVQRQNVRDSDESTVTQCSLVSAAKVPRAEQPSAGGGA